MTIERAIYLHGFASGPDSDKGRYFRQRFEEHGIELAVPDLNCEGFEQLTFSRQIECAAELLRSGPPCPVIGSSLGGLLALYLGDRYPDHVTAVVAMCPALGFHERRLQELGPDGVRRWRAEGYIAIHHHATGREERLGTGMLEEAPEYAYDPPAHMRTLILQGREDRQCDPHRAMAYAEAYPHVHLVLLDSDHQLLDVKERLWDEIRQFLDIDHPHRER